MKKKQLKTIAVLCVLLVVLCGGYFFASRYQNAKEQAEQEEEQETELYSFEEDAITKLHYSNSKADLTLVKEDDQWVLEGNKDFPVEQSTVETMVSDVASVSATKVVTEDCEDLSEYELDEPTLEIEITDSDGNVQSITYGMESVAAAGCYAYTDNEKTVYVVSSTVTSDFEYSKNDLMELPEIGDISEEYVTVYSVQKKNKTTFRAVYDEDNAEFKEIYGWDITAPYSQTVAGDQDGLQTAFSSATLLEFTSGVSYNASKKEIKKYGLESPKYTLTVKYYTVESDEEEEDTEDTDTEIAEEDKEYHTLKLYIGKKDDSGENYYARMEGDAGIYLLSTDTVSSLVEVDAFSCVYATPCPVNTDALEEISLEYEGETYHMTLSKEEVSDDEDDSDDSSDTEYEYTAKINGTEVDEESFRSAYEAFSEITYSSAINKSVKVKGKKAVATITFTEEERESTVTFLPYDGVNFYRVDVDGVCQFLAEKNTVDSVLEDLIAVE